MASATRLSYGISGRQNLSSKPFKNSVVSIQSGAPQSLTHRKNIRKAYEIIPQKMQKIWGDGPFLSSSRAISCFACFVHDINHTGLGHLPKSSERFLQSWCTVMAVVLCHGKNFTQTSNSYNFNTKMNNKKSNKKNKQKNNQTKKQPNKTQTKLLQVQDTISFSLGAWGSGVSGTAVDATCSSWSSPPSASNDPASLSGCGLGGKGCRRRTVALPI